MRKLLAPAMAASILAAVAAIAQPPIAPPPRGGGEGPVPIGPDGPLPVGPDGVAKKDGAEVLRITRLQQLQFDRRASTILKAWAPASKSVTPAPTKNPKEEALDKELAAFQKHVTLGEWAAVRTYLASLPDEEAIIAYRQMLQSLQRPQQPGGGGPIGRIPEQVDGIPPELLAQLVPGTQQFMERNVFSPEDLLGLVAAAPKATNAATFPARAAVMGPGLVLANAPNGLTKEHLATLAVIVRETIAGGTLAEVLVARLKQEVARPADQAVITRRQAARLLIDANEAAYAGDFLPTAEEAQKAGDLEALNLLVRHYLALHLRERKSGNLEKAWSAVQAVLAFPGGAADQKEEALLKAVELAPRVKEELGQSWLDESFTKSPERGMEILATVGSLVSKGISSRPFATEERLNALKLMKTAVEALLKAAPERAKQWKPTLTLLAAAWLREAELSQRFDTSTNPQLRRDRYGNMFFFDDEPAMRQPMMRPDMPRPIPTGDVLRAGPNEAWVATVDDAFRPKLAELKARLHLKASEEDKAFPLIETMATAQPDEARELVREFLRVWTKNHDPNASRNENRYSWFFFAFEQRAESIPLTRSKQERNLAELAGWAARIRKLPGNAELDDELLVKAFTACHSSAEVYKTEAIEAVFGPIGTLKPRTLAALAQQMRENLAGLWKDPREQQAKKTNRKKEDIKVEVLRGYAVAKAVVDDGLKKFPDQWSLLSAKAGLLHDEINYNQELAKTADYSAKRSEALAVYRKAAAAYGQIVKNLPESEHTTSVYELWFAASLGAVDLGMITEDKLPDWNQPPLIRAAILSLPGELADKHMARFANNLFIRMSGAKPHVKFNYLKAGFEIVRDHKQAAEAKKVFDYYKDLVTEIKLDAAVDGPSRVGHSKPFGLFVNLRHTRDIERESGGFGRYLQNQNGTVFAYNYGRPTADYRDRFETTARAALKEHFEVISVTFQDDKVHSRALPEFGWRYTPYAYILLKPRGPQVDKVPPLRIDLDFLDTSGYVVLPIESPALPIDCRDADSGSRPVEKLTVTQTLDERQAGKGVLLLEVKAVGVGLVPELDQLCTIAPEGFEIAKIEDQGLAVRKFDEDAAGNAIVSERTWLITLRGRDGLAELPKTFRFPTMKLPTKETIYQRYSDADLVTVTEEIALDQTYGQKSTLWIWLAVGGGLLGIVLLVGLVVLIRRARKPVATVPLPATLDPFIVIALMRQTLARPDLPAERRAALEADLATVERFYFSAEVGSSTPPDLRALAERWTAA